MPKRFTDTDKWKDEWYSELSIELKLAYMYVLDNCDQVGVWKPNFKLAEFQLSIKIDWNNFKEALGAERLLIFENNWWLKKFCDFQYGQLLETSKSQTTVFYIKLLKKHSLWIAYTEGIYTPKDKEKDKEKYKVQETEKENDEIDIWKEDEGFLKKDEIWWEQSIGMKWKEDVKELDFALLQYWLALRSGNKQGSTKRSLQAGFQKWLNSWVQNKKNGKSNSKGTRQGHDIEGVNSVADEVLAEYRRNNP